MYGNTVKDGSGNAWWILVDSEGRIVTNGDSLLSSLQSEVSLDSSDKTITVPASTVWEISSIMLSLITTATAGNRQVAVLFTDGSDNVVMEIRAGAVQAASLTRYYAIAPGLPDLTSFRDTNYLSTPLPAGIILPAGYKIRMYDKAAIDAAADTLSVRMMVKSKAA